MYLGVDCASIEFARATEGECGVMPSRFVSMVILIYWLIAAFCLVAWDVIPELGSGYPPGYGGDGACAGDSSRSVRWKW